MVDLRDREPEPLPELGLHGLQVLPLALERARLGEVQLDGEDADVSARHGGIQPPVAAVYDSYCGSGSRCRGAAPAVQVRALDLARHEGLEDVAFLHVVVVVEQDPALEALGHLAHVVLEALELRDRGLVDDRAVADDPHLARCAARRRVVTMQPAIVPSRETRKSARTSASPSVSSVCTGESIPTSACWMSSVSW